MDMTRDDFDTPMTPLFRIARKPPAMEALDPSADRSEPLERAPDPVGGRRPRATLQYA